MITEIELIEYGIFLYKSEDLEIDKSENSLTGYFLHTDKIDLINQVDTLKMDKGLCFGIKYFIKGAGITTEYLSRIKPPILENPDTNLKSSETVELKYAYLNMTNTDFYIFEHDWEMANGEWEFIIEQDNKILLSKKFRLEKSFG